MEIFLLISHPRMKIKVPLETSQLHMIIKTYRDAPLTFIKRVPLLISTQ